ncbi:hypothetical protein ACJMK2_035467 [Sinanodonta woodiana]|uniref:MULE transposase domain-containing protein n=1 Tax=Sinanodonta woodiana TaxID=1069815 RepID=A0ABD3WYK3_SINWO
MELLKFHPLFFSTVTIHALIDDSVIPLVYCLIKDKAENTYTRVFEKFKELKPSLNPQSIMSDFEKTTHNAIQRVFPEARLVGCLFHLSQCLWRKVQELCLAHLYQENEEIRMAVKMMLALSFVPSYGVFDSFEEFVQACPNEITLLADYWEDTYIGRRRKNQRASPRFAVHIWNLNDPIDDNLQRTNNSMEAWHRAFQQRIDCNHPSVFKLINRFRFEQDHVESEIERRQSGGNHPEASKKKCLQLNRGLQAVVSTYANTSLMEYLRSVANNLEL